jgi:hypothetical protein
MHPAVEQGQQQLLLCRGKMQLTRRSGMLLEHAGQKDDTVKLYLQYLVGSGFLGLHCASTTLVYRTAVEEDFSLSCPSHSSNAAE